MTTTIKRYYDPKEAKKALEEYNPDINMDLYRQAGLYGWWNSLLVQAEMQYDRLSNAIDTVEAKLDEEIRAEALAAGTKVTEGVVKARIATNPKLLQLKSMVIEAKAEVGYLKGTVFALKHRLDALLQIARNMIVEMKDATVAGHVREDRRERLASVLASVRPQSMETDETW